MAFNFELKIDDKVLHAKLAELKASAQKVIASRALRAGLKVAQKGIAAQAKQPSVKRSIGYRVRIAPSKAKLVAKVGVNVGKKPRKRGMVTAVFKTSRKGQVKAVESPRFQVPQAVFVAVGSKPRYHKDGSYAGVMPSDNFVRRGWAASKGAAAAKMNEVMTTEIQAQWNKR